MVGSKTTWAVIAALAVVLGATEARAGCSKDTDCKGDRICHEGVCAYPSSVRPAATPDQPPPPPPLDQPPPPPAQPPPLPPATSTPPPPPPPPPPQQAPAATTALTPPNGSAPAGQGDPGWALSAGILGTVGAGIVLLLAIGAEVTDDNDVGIPLGASAAVTLAVMGPVTNAGSGSARSRAGVRGVPALRVSAWIIYGLALLDACVAIGLAAADERIPDGVPVALGILGSSGLVFFAVDAFVARRQALDQRAPAVPTAPPAAAPALTLSPMVAPLRLADGSSTSLFGLGGSF